MRFKTDENLPVEVHDAASVGDQGLARSERGRRFQRPGLRRRPRRPKTLPPLFEESK